MLAGGSDRAGGASATMNWTLTALSGQGWSSSGTTLRAAAVVAGTGGATGTGGVTATGGVSGTGGVTATGGVSGTGGVTATGGVSGTGGTSGGVTATGGTLGLAGAGGAEIALATDAREDDGHLDPGAQAPLDAAIDDAAVPPGLRRFGVGCACELAGRPRGFSGWLLPLAVLLALRVRRPR
jgi:hypothetical protein